MFAVHRADGSLSPTWGVQWTAALLLALFVPLWLLGMPLQFGGANSMFGPRWDGQVAASRFLERRDPLLLTNTDAPHVDPATGIAVVRWSHPPGEAWVAGWNDVIHARLAAGQPAQRFDPAAGDGDLIRALFAARSAEAVDVPLNEGYSTERRFGWGDVEFAAYEPHSDVVRITIRVNGRDVACPEPARLVRTNPARREGASSPLLGWIPKGSDCRALRSADGSIVWLLFGRVEPWAGAVEVVPVPEWWTAAVDVATGTVIAVDCGP